MNPYPFAPLNHFTVPFSLTEKTPFTNREELFSRSLGSRFDRLKPPSKKPVEISVASTMCRRKYFQKGKDSSVLHCGAASAARTFGVRQFGAYSTTPNKRQPLTGLTTGPLPGIEQQIISSIETFRKKN